MNLQGITCKVYEGWAPLTPAEANAHVAAGGYIVVLHPETYLRLQIEIHGGYPRALQHWEDRITRERAIPKPRLP